MVGIRARRRALLHELSAVAFATAEDGELALAAYASYDSELLDQLLDLRAFHHGCFIVWYESSRDSRRGGAAAFVEWLMSRRSRLAGYPSRRSRPA